MLQDRLLSFRRLEGDRVVPTWLTSRDEVWLRVLVDEAEAFAGRSADAADERVRDAVIPIARLHGAGARAVLGVWCIERRRWKKRVASNVPPERIRRTVFGLAVNRSRPEALEEASRELGLAPAEIEGSLFADREGARVLVLPSDPPTPAELVERYNLALAQALLMRSFEIVAEVRANARRVVGFAKLHGLMATFESLDEGTKVTLSGPLALFHETMKYGRALAGFLPALAVTPAWSLSAQILLGGRRHELALDATAPLPRTHALPASSDSAVERRLAVDLRRLASGWELAREDTVVRVGSRLFYPDFTLVSARGRVLVEIVGYWTPQYLASKAEALRAVKVPMVVCVDERHARGDLSPGPGVLAYRGRVDVSALVAEAERMLGGVSSPRVEEQR
jgi:predicted nuclease of restriction endonuclease-like RecB superfamily